MRFKQRVCSPLGLVHVRLCHLCPRVGGDPHASGVHIALHCTTAAIRSEALLGVAATEQQFPARAACLMLAKRCRQRRKLGEG